MIPTGFQVELLDYEDNSKITYRLIEPTYGERYLGAGFSHGERRIYTERVLTEGGNGRDTVSIESPIGNAIRNGNVGEDIEYISPSGIKMRFKILRFFELFTLEEK